MTHFITSAPGKSNSTLAITHEVDKIMQTFPNPICLTSSSICPKSLQILQLSVSSLFQDLMTSLICLRYHQKSIILFYDFTKFLQPEFFFHSYLDVALLSPSLLFKFFPYYFYALSSLSSKPWCLQNFHFIFTLYSSFWAPKHFLLFFNLYHKPFFLLFNSQPNHAPSCVPNSLTHKQDAAAE